MTFKLKGFTLAEVLITLGIIGVVAALTMPSLIANYKEKETVTRVKKFYSIISQAYLQAVNENGTPDNWGLVNGPAGGGIVFDNIIPYLKVTQTCRNAGDCNFNYPAYKFLSGSASGNPNSSMANAILADGTMFFTTVVSPDCSQAIGSSKALTNFCGWFYFDINGIKAPNQVGEDMFLFAITKEAIVPSGTQDEITYPFSTNCTSASLGWGCAAWLIYNENMQYLKCSGLDWNGKTKCD